MYSLPYKVQSDYYNIVISQIILINESEKGKRVVLNRNFDEKLICEPEIVFWTPDTSEKLYTFSGKNSPTNSLATFKLQISVGLVAISLGNI